MGLGSFEFFLAYFNIKIVFEDPLSCPTTYTFLLSGYVINIKFCNCAIENQVQKIYFSLDLSVVNNS